MLNLTRHGSDMPGNTENSRMEELEETVKNLSQKVETLWNENAILDEKSKKSDTWVAQLIGCCKELARRVSSLEEKCSTLTRELDLQNLHNAVSMTISIEEKSLNNDRYISEMLPIQPSHIPEPTMGEFATAMDEFAAGVGEFAALMEGELQLEPEHQNVPPYDMNAQLEPIAATSTNWKRKAQEMAESGPGMPTPPSSSYSSPITFLNTFSDEAPTRRSTRNPARRVGRPKAGMPLTPPEEPVQERQAQETQDREEALQVTEEEHAEAISALFETPDLRYDDSEYDLFRGSNWVC